MRMTVLAGMAAAGVARATGSGAGAGITVLAPGAGASSAGNASWTETVGTAGVGGGPPSRRAAMRAMVGAVSTSPSTPVCSRFSIMVRRMSVAERMTSMISGVTGMLPLRSSSRMFSALWAKPLMAFKPKKPDAPLRECMGRKISFKRLRLPGFRSSSRRLGSMVSRCSRASTMKSANSSGSMKSWLIKAPRGVFSVLSPS